MATISRSDRLDSMFLLPQIHKIFARQGIFTQNKRVNMTTSHNLSGKRSVQTHPSAGRTSIYISPYALPPLKCGRKGGRSKH